MGPPEPLRLPLLALLFGALIPLLGSGCGYSSGFRAPAGIQSLGVPIMDNQTFPLRRGLEVDLTRELKAELRRRSDLTLRAGPEGADAVLFGTILEFRQGVLVEGADDEVQESGISIRVRIRLIRSRDGAVLIDRIIQDHASFSNLAGETIDTARAEAVREIARRIVPQIEPWESRRD